MAKKTRLSQAQVARLRELAWTVLNGKFAGVRTRMALAMGVSKPSLSRLLSGKQGIAEPLAQQLVDLAEADPETYGLGAPDSTRAPRPGLLGSLPSWADAEARARLLYPHLPDAAWVDARKFSTSVPLIVLTPDVVLHLALACDAARLPAQRAS